MTTVPMLTDEEILFKTGPTLGYGNHGDLYSVDFLEFARAIEQAVRAQFEARIEDLDRVVSSDTDTICQLRIFLDQRTAERDTARAQAARMRGLVAFVLASDDHITESLGKEWTNNARAALREQSHE